MVESSEAAKRSKVIEELRKYLFFDSLDGIIELQVDRQTRIADVMAKLEKKKEEKASIVKEIKTLESRQTKLNDDIDALERDLKENFKQVGESFAQQIKLYLENGYGMRDFEKEEEKKPQIDEIISGY
jgi:septal ring factor EnvC (AmiA/AmiB activator)